MTLYCNDSIVGRLKEVLYALSRPGSCRAAAARGAAEGVATVAAGGGLTGGPGSFHLSRAL